MEDYEMKIKHLTERLNSKLGTAGLSKIKELGDNNLDDSHKKYRAVMMVYLYKQVCEKVRSQNIDGQDAQIDDNELITIVNSLNNSENVPYFGMTRKVIEKFATNPLLGKYLGINSEEIEDLNNKCGEINGVEEEDRKRLLTGPDAFELEEKNKFIKQKIEEISIETGISKENLEKSEQVKEYLADCYENNKEVNLEEMPEVQETTQDGTVEYSDVRNEVVEKQKNEFKNKVVEEFINRNNIEESDLNISYPEIITIVEENFNELEGLSQYGFDSFIIDKIKKYVYSNSQSNENEKENTNINILDELVKIFKNELIETLKNAPEYTEGIEEFDEVFIEECIQEYIEKNLKNIVENFDEIRAGIEELNITVQELKELISPELDDEDEKYDQFPFETYGI